MYLTTLIVTVYNECGKEKDNYNKTAVCAKGEQKK